MGYPHGGYSVANWIKTDDASREWPAGSCVVCYDPPRNGERLGFAARFADGHFEAREDASPTVTPAWFFYLPSEPF